MIKEIIDGLQFTVDMFLFDPMTGETLTVPKSDMDKITIDACKGAIKLLEQILCGDLISRIETEKHLITRLYESALNNVGYKCDASDTFIDIAENRLNTWITEIPSISI